MVPWPWLRDPFIFEDVWLSVWPPLTPFVCETNATTVATLLFGGEL